MVKGKNRRLAFIVANYFGQCRGGAELQSEFVARQARQQGWDIHYCFVSNGNKYSTRDDVSLYPIRKRFLWSKLSNIKYPYHGSLLRVLRQIRPEVIYQRGATSFTGIAARYAARNPCRLVYHVASDPEVQASPLPWARPWLIPELLYFRYGLRNAGTVIAQTQMQADALKENYNRQAAVIPNGHPDPGECEKTERPLRVLWIANWKQLKRPELFVELAERIGGQGGIRFVMLGRQDGYRQLADRAKHIGIDVPGEVTNERVNELLTESHVLVNTSSYEGFSNTFVQAWMRKVPVVSLSVDPDKLLTARQLGFRSGSFDQLVSDTRLLLGDSELRNRLGARSRNYALNHCSMENMKRIVDIIAE